ncbi:MAG: (d)CMP kinase [Bradymonadaceae bacterium]
MIVAIDGPAGAGKSTVARRVADRLDFQYVDTGAIYRGVAREALESGIPPEDGPAVAELARGLAFDFREVDGGRLLHCDGRPLDEGVRTARIGEASSKVSSNAEVREALLDIQRELGRRRSSVLEGRDIGTVVFPDAEVKVFLTAEPGERARRRLAERADEEVDRDSEEFQRVLEEIVERDRRDRQRDVAPLRPPDDAVEIDSTDLSIGEVVDRIVGLVEDRCGEAN